MKSIKTGAMIILLLATATAWGAAPSYEMVEIEEKRASEKAPNGHWTISLNYPEFEGKAAKALNGAIKSLASKHQCEGEGDYSFTVEMTEVTESRVSGIYKAKWYCPSMLSPDFTQSSFTFDIK